MWASPSQSLSPFKTFQINRCLFGQPRNLSDVVLVEESPLDRSPDGVYKQTSNYNLIKEFVRIVTI